MDVGNFITGLRMSVGLTLGRKTGNVAKHILMFSITTAGVEESDAAALLLETTSIDIQVITSSVISDDDRWQQGTCCVVLGEAILHSGS